MKRDKESVRKSDNYFYSVRNKMLSLDVFYYLENKLPTFVNQHLENI